VHNKFTLFFISYNASILSESEFTEFENFQDFIVSGMRNEFPKHRFLILAKILNEKQNILVGFYSENSFLSESELPEF